MKHCHAQENNHGEFLSSSSRHDAESVLYFGFFFFVDLCTSFLIERNKYFPILIMRIIHYFLF
jgi:hypothetical protein